jgi:arsenate reductase (thioredoxin)
MPATTTILSLLERTITKLEKEFDLISRERRSTIHQLTEFIAGKSKGGEQALLNFICTHNSRRSHISQIWAQTAAARYGVENVQTFSGGTEATAFNPRAVDAMKAAGFVITTKKDGSNPVYEVRFSNEEPPLTVFSKKYDDPFNPKKDFAAVMTCSHADENLSIDNWRLQTDRPDLR